MKHSLWDKFALVLLCLLLILVALAAAGIALHFTRGDALIACIYGVGESIPMAIGVVLLSLLLLALALRVVYVFIFQTEDDRTRSASVMIREGENGSLQISSQALETMIQQYCKRIPSIQRSECALPMDGKNAVIALCIAFIPETDIADEIVKLQDGLREHLKSACGLTVEKVDITIIPNNEGRKSMELHEQL